MLINYIYEYLLNAPCHPPSPNTASHVNATRHSVFRATQASHTYTQFTARSLTYGYDGRARASVMEQLFHIDTHTHRAAIFENTKTENSERMSNMEMVKKHRAGNLMCHFRQRYSATAVAYKMARLVYVCNLSAILCCRAQRTVRAQNAR